MRMTATIMLAICLVGQCFSAEELTLTDGRHLTGTYDADTSTLYLDAAKKMSLHITADQIVERKEIAEVKPAEAKPADSMTKEEKDKAIAGFRKAQVDGEKQRQLDLADRKDKEAATCLKQYDADGERIKECVRAFQRRSQEEGAGVSEDGIKEEKIILPKTGANNSDILALVAHQKKMKQQAKDLKKEAQEIRAKYQPPAPAPVAQPASAPRGPLGAPHEVAREPAPLPPSAFPKPSLGIRP